MGVTMGDAIHHLRARTVPSGHRFHSWRPGILDLSRYSLLGKTESLEEEMKSILAQFEYCNTVKEFDTKGTPFCTYM